MAEKTKGVIKYLLIGLAIFLIYFIAGELGLSLTFGNASVSPVWPATGIAITALVLLGYRFWPAIFIGTFLFNLGVTPSFPVSLGIALGNTLEGLAGAYMINKYAKGKSAFNNLDTTWKFFLAISIAPIISAVIGLTSLFFGGFVSSSGLMPLLFTWWIGDVVGALLVFPLIVAWYNKPPILIKKERYLEMILAFLILIIISLVLFVGWPIQINKSYHLAFLCLPPLLWIAYRSCLRISILANFIISAIAIVGTVFNLGIFNPELGNFPLVVLQLFIGVITITTTLLAVISVEYRKLLMKIKK